MHSDAYEVLTLEKSASESLYGSHMFDKGNISNGIQKGTRLNVHLLEILQKPDASSLWLFIAQLIACFLYNDNMKAIIHAYHA